MSIELNKNQNMNHMAPCLARVQLRLCRGVHVFPTLHRILLTTVVVSVNPVFGKKTRNKHDTSSRLPRLVLIAPST